MRIGDLGEFGFIRSLENRFSIYFPAGVRGIGDDCAVIPQADGSAWLITTDTLIEDVHFILGMITSQDLGYKSLAVSLSDIAAMGGTPRFAFLSLAIRKGMEMSVMDSIITGVRNLCSDTETYLLGGDTTRSPGPLMINFTVVGSMPLDQVRLRSLARVGDVLCVTDFLGDSGGGLNLLLQRLPTNDRDARYLVKQHQRPRPNLGEGQWLAQQEAVRAMIDLSDGIDSDCRRIAEQSSCGVEIHLEKLPLSPIFSRVADRYGWNALEIAATAGEDYCLMATVNSRKFNGLRRGFQKRFHRTLYPIGRITDNLEQICYRFRRQQVVLTRHGFEHFSKDGRS